MTGDQDYSGLERRGWRPAINWTIGVSLLLAALAGSFNLGQQWNRQDRITELTGDMREVRKQLAEGAERDAQIGGHLENLGGKLDSVWGRQAEDQKGLADLRVAHARTDARVEILMEQGKGRVGP